MSEAIVIPSAAPETADAQPFVYATFRRRFAARLIDFVFELAFAVLAGAVVAIAVLLVAPRPDVAEVLERSEYVVLNLLAGIAYHTIMEGLHGSTIGKRLLGLTVRDESGRPCGITAAFLRSVAILIDGMFFGFVASHVMQGNDKQQRVGDRWGKTIVVRYNSVPREDRRSAPRFAAALMLAVTLSSAIRLAYALVELFGR